MARGTSSISPCPAVWEPLALCTKPGHYRDLRLDRWPLFDPGIHETRCRGSYSPALLANYWAWNTFTQLGKASLGANTSLGAFAMILMKKSPSEKPNPNLR